MGEKILNLPVAGWWPGHDFMHWLVQKISIKIREKGWKTPTYLRLVGGQGVPLHEGVDVDAAVAQELVTARTINRTIKHFHME